MLRCCIKGNLFIWLCFKDPIKSVQFKFYVYKVILEEHYFIWQILKSHWWSIFYTLCLFFSDQAIIIMLSGCSSIQQFLETASAPFNIHLTYLNKWNIEGVHSDTIHRKILLGISLTIDSSILQLYVCNIEHSWEQIWATAMIMYCLRAWLGPSYFVDIERLPRLIKFHSFEKEESLL